MNERYANKRGLHRRGGRFAKARPADYGIGGTCECGGLLIRHYDGDAKADQGSVGIDPRKFRYRCFHCKPRTPEEMAAIEAEKVAAQEKSKQFWATLAA